MSDWQKCFGYEPKDCPNRVDVRYDNLGKHQNNNMHKTIVSWDCIKRWRPAATDATHPAAESPREVSDGQPDDAQTSPAPEHSDAPAEPGVQDTLNARGARYGDFTENASISQHLKQVLQHDGNDVREGWLRCSAVQREALEMIAQKIARILNGDPNYTDNWHDIQGYARLAEERCKE